LAASGSALASVPESGRINIGPAMPAGAQSVARGVALPPTAEKHQHLSLRLGSGQEAPAPVDMSEAGSAPAQPKAELDVLASVLSALTLGSAADNKYVTQRPAATLKEILEKIRANQDRIRELDLKEMSAKKRKLRASGGDLVGRVFQVNRTVLRLLLPDHEIGDVGAKAMGSMLRANNTLQHLDLRGNEITAVGCGAIGDALYGHETLEHLGLSSNKLGDDGAKAIAQVLPFNISLKYLGLANNGIGAEGGEALLEAILRNRSLVMVQLVRNDIPQETLDKIRAALVVNKLMANKAKRDEEKELKRDEEREKELERLKAEVMTATNQEEEDSSSDDDEEDESLWI
ncbi:hypothetical protein BBJ28_00020300, partial [Nothophytophthora sp. Chile5]